MPSKTKIRHRVTFAPDTKTEEEQLNCLARAIEFNGPGIDELANMIQSIPLGYTSSGTKRKPSFDSNSIIQQLRNTLDSMLDSELTEITTKSCVGSSSSSNEDYENDNNINNNNSNNSLNHLTIKEEEEEEINVNLKDNTKNSNIQNEKINSQEIDKRTETAVTLTSKYSDDNAMRKLHDSAVSDIGGEIIDIDEKINDQTRKRVSGLINKLDSCILQLQHLTETIDEDEEESPDNNSEKNTENNDLSNKPKFYNVNNKEIYNKNNDSNNNNINNTLNEINQTSYTQEPVSYLNTQNDNNNQKVDSRFSNFNNYENYYMKSSSEEERLNNARNGIFTIPNQPTIIEACYSGFLLSAVITVIAGNCSVTYFGILTENNLYFYNSTMDDEPMFGRIIIDQHTKVSLIPTTLPESRQSSSNGSSNKEDIKDNEEQEQEQEQKFILEINGIYVLPDNQLVNSTVQIKFNCMQERNIWYKVIRTTINDWQIKASILNNNNSIAKGNNGRKRRLSFLSSIKLQPVPRIDTHFITLQSNKKININDNNANITDDSSTYSYSGEYPSPITPITTPYSTSASPDSMMALASPTSPSTTFSNNNYSKINMYNSELQSDSGEDSFGRGYGVSPSQSILSALHVLESLERKRGRRLNPKTV